MKKENKNMALKILFFFLAAGILTSSVFAQSGGGKNSPKDVKIFVEYKLAKDNQLNNDNISVSVNNRTVTLTGTVPTIYERNKAAEEARNAAGNYNVTNNLTIEQANIPAKKVVESVLNKIHGNAFYGVFDWVNAKDANGVVTLTGWVHLPWYKDWFQKEAEKVVGVRVIKNDIQETFGPGEIGYRAARLIYSDPMYQGLQYSTNPPVHIIVNNGSIILEGNVGSNSESGWIENLLRFNTNAVNVNNYLGIRS